MPADLPAATQWRAELGGRLNDQNIALAVGTRPEAIKLAPLAKALLHRGLLPHLELTGQHPNLCASDYGIPPLATTELCCGGQPDPFAHTKLVTRAIGAAIASVNLVVVQGDISSAFGGALGGAQCGVPVAHVEAGLRSHDRRNPWPEEDFRIAIDRLAELLFAPTWLNAANLRRERMTGAIRVTGNTGRNAGRSAGARHSLAYPSRPHRATGRVRQRQCHARRS